MRHKLLLGLGVVVLGVVGAGAAGRALDRARGLELAGRKATPEAVDAVARTYGTTPVVLHTPAGDVRSTAAELGVSVDVGATRAALDQARPGEPLDWLRALRGRRKAPLVVATDLARVRDVLRSKDPNQRVDAVEPTIQGAAAGITVVDGRPGRGLAPTTVADAVRTAARSGPPTVEADVAPEPLAPRFQRADAERLADEARQATDQPLAVRAGTATATVAPATLRSWVRSDADLHLVLDAAAVQRDLGTALAAVDAPASDATVRIENGSPVIVPDRQGAACCADDSPARTLAALLHRPAAPVTLSVRTTEPARTTADVVKLKIVEPIGSFTTQHPAGQPRVVNIHRIADLVDGTLIGPGGRFSVNGKIGERTTAKGFVTDHSIAGSVFVETVGGGISQFATTLFNAAFFGGLDIPEYQSHSLYISRYPYGREATLSWPKPDLVISNTTPYGVLIDTSYTGTSLTITLWSTRYASGAQTGQSTSPVGHCTRVRTERTRTYVDGHTKLDAVYATYNPAEGVNC